VGCRQCPHRRLARLRGAGDHQCRLRLLDRPQGSGRSRAARRCPRQCAGHRRLPVSADLEAGFGRTSEDVAETIRRAAAVGLVGGSIEDATYDPACPIYDLSEAVDRVSAGIAAARSLPFPFTFPARAEQFLFGRRDLDDTIRRLQAFEKAGADVLYAPGLNDLDMIRTVCRSVSKPVNVVMGLKGRSFSVAELAEAGVRRISVGSALCRAAYGALFRAAREMKEHGTFDWANDAVAFAEVDALMVNTR
jgi:2-methylisocitrate lyase-like PEP mutase family enzyme